MGRRDRVAPNNLPRTSHSRFPPYLHDCNASLFLLGDTEHCCVNSPISLSSHASFKSPSSPPAHPFCFLYSHHPVFCLYECFNIKSIVGSLFFCLHQGGGACGARWSNPRQHRSGTRAAGECVTHVLPHFDVLCDLNRPTPTRNLFV